MFKVEDKVYLASRNLEKIQVLKVDAVREGYCGFSGFFRDNKKELLWIDNNSLSYTIQEAIYKSDKLKQEHDSWKLGGKK